jgi:hypothetical protein
MIIEQFVSVQFFVLRVVHQQPNNNNNNNNNDRTWFLIDVAIQTHRNIIQKEAKKKLKYKNLNIEF